MKLLMISRDVKILEEGSAVHLRLLEYAKLFDEIHVMVLGVTHRKKISAKEVKGVFLYDTTSRFKLLSFLRTLGAAIRVARNMNKKEDWITSQDPFEAGIVAFVASKFSGLRLQFQVHTDCFNFYFIRHSIGNAFRALLARVLVPSADSLRVVSLRIKDSILRLKIMGPKPRVIHVLPIFIDTEAIRNKKLSFNLKEKYPQFNKIILILARLEKEKNIGLALISFQKMLRTDDSLGLVIAGSGREEKWLREYVKHLGIEQSVCFEGWVSDVVSAYKSADLLLVTSFYEGYGMNIIEALASGVPVISTDVGVASEVGAHIVSFDAGEIALKAKRILETKDVRDTSFPVVTKEDYLKGFKDTFRI